MLDLQSQDNSGLQPTETNPLLTPSNSPRQIPHLSENSKGLLKKLEIPKVDIGFDQEEIEMLNLITNMGFFGKCIHTILNKSLSKTLLLSLLISRENIIQNNFNIQQPNNSTNPLLIIGNSSQSTDDTSSDESSSSLVSKSSSESSDEKVLLEKDKNVIQQSLIQIQPDISINIPVLKISTSKSSDDTSSDEPENILVIEPSVKNQDRIVLQQPVIETQQDNSVTLSVITNSTKQIASGTSSDESESLPINKSSSESSEERKLRNEQKFTIQQSPSENQQNKKLNSPVHTKSSSQSSDETSSGELLNELIALSTSESNEEILLQRSKNLFSEIYEKSSYLSSPVLFQNKKALKKIAGLIAFQETVTFIFEGTWNVFFISLLANGLINIGIYADQLTSASEKIDYLKSIPWVATNTINGVLSRPWFYGPLIGIPLIWGMLKSIRTYSNYNIEDMTKEAEKVLEDYATGIVRDVLGWLFTSILPEWLPLLSPITICNVAATSSLEYISCGCFICSCLPQYKLQEIMEEIKHAIVWDGTLASEKREKLFNIIFDFRKKAKFLTYAYILSWLANIIKEIDDNKLKYMKEKGVDAETLSVLLKIKTMAFQELYYLAHQYDSDNPQNINDRSRLACLYSNHLIGSSGYPQEWYAYISPLAYHVLRYISIGLFIYTVTMAAYPIIKCRQFEGKKWDYFEEIENYICHVCGDFPVPFSEILTAQKCISAFFSMPKTVEELELFIDSIDLSEVENLDISRQIEIFKNETQLGTLLNKLKPKLKNLKSFEAIIGNLERQYKIPTKIIAKFIESSKINYFRYRESIANYVCDSQYYLDTISNILTNANILSFNIGLHCQFYESPANLQSLIDGLKNSSVTNLTLEIEEVDNANISSFGEGLPKTNLLNLDFKILLDLYKTEENFCSSFSRNVVASKINSLSFSSRYNINTDSSKCGTAFLYELQFINRSFSLVFDLQEINEAGADLLANLISQGKIKSLMLGSSAIGNSFKIKNVIFRSISKSNLEEFSFRLGGDETSTDASLLVDILANSINTSKVKALTIRGGLFGPRQNIDDVRPSVILFAKYLSSELSGLTYLSFLGNSFSANEIKSISPSLEKTNITTLVINDGNIGYGISYIGEVLPKTSISELYLFIPWIKGNVSSLLFKNIAKSSLSVLDFESFCHVGAICAEEEAIDSFFMELPKSSLKVLKLVQVGVTERNILLLSKQLVRNVSSLYLWPNLIEGRKKDMVKNTNISILYVQTNFNDLFPPQPSPGFEAICNILPYTNIDPIQFIDGASRSFTTSRFEKCGVLSSNSSDYSSGSSRLSIPLIWKVPYQICMFMRSSAYDIYVMLIFSSDLSKENSFNDTEILVDELEDAYEDIKVSCEELSNTELTDDLHDNVTTVKDNFNLLPSQVPSSVNLRRIGFFNQQSEVFLPESTFSVSSRSTELSSVPVLSTGNGFGNSNNQNTSQACLGMAIIPGIGTVILSLIALYLIYRALSPAVNSMWESRVRLFSSPGNSNLPEQSQENNQLSLQKK